MLQKSKAHLIVRSKVILVILQVLCLLELQFPSVDVEAAKLSVHMMGDIVLILCKRQET